MEFSTQLVSNLDELIELRSKMNHLDESLGVILIERYLLSKKIQTLKASKNLSSIDLSRENSIVNEIKEKFPNIPAETLENIYQEIFNWMRG